MEDKNKEIQLTDEEIEEVSGGYDRRFAPVKCALTADQASNPTNVGTAERMKEVK